MRLARVPPGMLVLLVAGLVVSGLVVDRAVVQATAIESEVTGTLSQNPVGQVVIDDGLGTDSLVSAMDFTPFLGREAALDGGVDDGTLYVRELTMGAIHVQVQHDGRITIDTTGTVEETEAGFEATIEGVTFTLDGDDLDRVVGQTGEIEGEVLGAYITLTTFRPV